MKVGGRSHKTMSKVVVVISEGNTKHKANPCAKKVLGRVTRVEMCGRLETKDRLEV